MTSRQLFCTTAISTLSLLCSLQAIAQTTVDTETTTALETSTAGDIDIGQSSDGSTTGSITVTTGTAVTIDSDNSVTNSGNILTSDANDTTGVNLVGGNTGSFTNSGNIRLDETFAPDNVLEGPFAEGSGRTGILISGSSPFEGDIDLQSGGLISMEGNNSFAVRLLEDAGLLGDFINEGQITVVGADSMAMSFEGQTTGNITNTGTISTRGENASVMRIAGDIDGQLSNGNAISNTGYRLSTRPSDANLALLNDDSFLQASAAVDISANISNGVYLRRITTTTTDDEGNETTALNSVSSVSQIGAAPAILIDGQGTPIAIGVVAEITDPASDDYDADLQYAFINEGSVSGTGVYDDVPATALNVADATLAGGIQNSGSMLASTTRSGGTGVDSVNDDGILFDAAARVIVLGDNAIADEINNSGLINATASEQISSIYGDRDNILDAKPLQAIAIDIGADASVQNLVNTGSISVVLNGRTGQAIAIQDASGSLTSIENRGSIFAAGFSSDALDEAVTDFDLIALDLSANSTGITINQLAAIDSDLDDDETPADPSIIGDIYLGAGDDIVNIEAGTIAGALAFAAGNDSLSLSGGSSYTGALTNTAGGLALAVSGGSTLTNTTATPLSVTNASFDGTSVFRPTLDGATGTASGLVSSGDITFADGAIISPLLQNLIGSAQTTFTVLDAGGSLNLLGNVGDLSGLETPFLYDAVFGLDPNNANALLITLDLRDATDLGLDPVQLNAFAPTIEALTANAGLGNAFVNITDEAEFNNAYSQLLPEFAAAARHFVLANVDGAVGAVGTHLNNTRLSTARPGGVWLQEFAYFADRDLAGLSEQYRGQGFGITGGADTSFGPFHTVGVNLGFASTEIEDVVGFDDPMDVLTLQLGGYAGFSSGALGIEGYVGGGINDFDNTRQINVGSFTDEATGSWKGSHYNASLKAGYDLPFGKRFFARPSVAIDYLRLKEDAYSEDGATGIALDVASRTSELGGATALLNIGATFDDNKTWIRPVVRLGYRNEFINDGVITDYGFVGLTERATLESALFPTEGIIVGFSVAAGSGYSSIGLDFDSDIRDGFIRHTGRLVVRLIF